MKTETSQTLPPVAVIGNNARDLPLHLREALNACLNLGVTPVMVESRLAGDREAIEAGLSLIDKADLYIGIFGDRYGYVPPGCNKSIGEMEYDRALERNIPRLIFVVARRQTTAGFAALKARVEAEAVVYPLGSPEEFRENLKGALRRAKKSIRKTGQSKVRFGGSYGRKSPRMKGGGAKRVGPKSLPTAIYKQTLRVFVASPKDVQDERSRMPLKVIDSINKTLGKLLPVSVELWRWEVDAAPAIGEPQALVNVELDKTDVVVVIFWNRFGTATPAGTTGTQSEVLRSLKRWHKVRRPQVMIYFCQRPSLLNGPDLEHRRRLLKFRERISSHVLAVDYENAQDFEWRVRDDLFVTISSLCVKHV